MKRQRERKMMTTTGEAMGRHNVHYRNRREERTMSKLMTLTAGKTHKDNEDRGVLPAAGNTHSRNI